MDLIGPIPHAKGNLQYTVVALEYFSKWVEPKPLTVMTSKNVQKFFWKNIIYHFDIPRQLTVDNGGQFDSRPFRQFYDDLDIELCYAVVCHPQSNGVVERANGNSSAWLEAYGSKSFPRFCGPSTPLSCESPGSPPSASYMATRP